MRMFPQPIWYLPFFSYDSSYLKVGVDDVHVGVCILHDELHIERAPPERVIDMVKRPQGLFFYLLVGTGVLRSRDRLSFLSAPVSVPWRFGRKVLRQRRTSPPSVFSEILRWYLARNDKRVDVFSHIFLISWAKIAILSKLPK